MTTLKLFGNEESVFDSVVEGLDSLGYRNELLKENYRFGDWFARSTQERVIDIAAFGQTPVSYESACFGVVKSHKHDLSVSHFRSLGAPIIFEVKSNYVNQWVVSRKGEKQPRPQPIPADNILDHFAANATLWKPTFFLRAKNVGDFRRDEQLELFAGSIPLLEEKIQEKLTPMLQRALAAASNTYQETSGNSADPETLFRLIFALLTGKVFHDRDVPSFDSINISDGADAVLNAVASYYKHKGGAKRYQVLNKSARNSAFERIWSDMIFLNLSVEVLAQIWSKALVSPEIRRKLGIHRTSRTIVKYIVERIPFDEVHDQHQTVVEPCCGSGAFLIGAMNRLRNMLWGLSPSDRHEYFSKHLIGFEKDSFGSEISQLSLTLADFPNPEGWQIVPADIFDKSGNKSLIKELMTAGVVLCNPPFEDFDDADRIQYKPKSVKKPVELLGLILDHLNPKGVIGFVLPRNAIDGQGYGDIRQRLAERFATIEITTLPDRAFNADPEVVLVVAKDPHPHRACRITHRKVNDSKQDWNQFEWFHDVSSEDTESKSIEAAKESIAIPDLKAVWDRLEYCDKLSDWAELHRGIEWNLPLTDDEGETGNRDVLVRSTKAKGFMLGVPPQSTFDSFEIPPLKHLDMRPEHRRGKAHERDWEKPKVILNKSTRSRGKWRISAFADHAGLVCYQTYISVWPRDDHSIDVIAAILNGPVANAYVSTREGKTDITLETLRSIPVPFVNDSMSKEIVKATKKYQNFVSKLRKKTLVSDADRAKCEQHVKEIDAVVLDAYQLSARLERQLLDYFNGNERPVPCEFGDYFPSDFEPCFRLKDWIKGRPEQATVDHFRESSKQLPSDTRELLAYRGEE